MEGVNCSPTLSTMECINCSPTISTMEGVNFSPTISTMEGVNCSPIISTMEGVNCAPTISTILDLTSMIGYVTTLPLFIPKRRYNVQCCCFAFKSRQCKILGKYFIQKHDLLFFII